MRKTPTVCYLLVVLALWPWPLLRILHVESSAVVAFAAFFIAGLSELPRLGPSGSLRSALRRQLGLLTVPWFLLSITLLITPNCAYATGLVYFVLFTAPSVVLGVGIAFLIRRSDLRRRRFVFVLVGGAIAVAGVLFDLGLHPQFYTFNHVFGGVMSPIYDEEFDFRWGLIAFRVLTLLLAAMCVIGGRLIQIRRWSRPAFGLRRHLRLRMTVCGVLAFGIYLFSAPLGINSPEWYIRKQLGAQYADDGLFLYYDATDLDSAAVEGIANSLLFHRARLDSLFDEIERDPIHVYLYPDAFTRERLTGARFTNVAPVWLRRPQMHVLSSESRRVLTHELVHIYAREFGLPVVNASPLVGLVEGLAVALEAPSGDPSAHDQVLASLVRQSAVDRQARAQAIGERLSVTGFWGGRGAVSYTSAGSFTDFLITHYGADRVRLVYRDGRFERAFGKPVDVLSEEWLDYLMARPLTSAAAGPTSQRRFSVPSLFERRCPHYTPLPRRHYLNAIRALAVGDTTLAINEAARAWRLDPSLGGAANLATQLSARRRDYQSILDLISSADVHALGPATMLRVADASFLTGETMRADSLYEDVLRVAPHSATEFRAGVVLRRRLFNRPWMLQILLDASGTDGVLVEDGSDSLALAISKFRSNEPASAVALTAPGSDADPLDEESLLLERLRLRLLESSSHDAGRMTDAAEAAGEIVTASLAAGDVDSARAAHYRRSYYLWLADRHR